MVRLCYPIDIMTATNWNNLQIYQCKKQSDGTFLLSIRHHAATSWKKLQIYPCKKHVGGTFMLANRQHDSYKLA